MSDPEQNKRNAIAFCELAFNDDKPREAHDRYAGDHYRQHNPGVGDGRAAFIEYLEQAARDYPGKRVEIKRAIAEGAYVALHCLQHWPGSADYAAIDIFRFDENGRIVEHWDVLQVVPDPAEAKNDNGMF